MAHADQFEFMRLIKQHLPAYFTGGRVLEIGSLDINGTVRSFFETKGYTGVDVAPGPGVDEVCQGQLVSYPSGTFDVVLSCECMEHNPFWVETVSNMFRMAKPGGLVIVSCATTGRAEHGTSRTSNTDSPLSISIGWEYYHNVSIEEFRHAFNLEYWCRDYVLLPNWNNCDLYFVGVKMPFPADKAVEPLGKALAHRFRPAHTTRSLIVGMAATFGEFGVGILRAIWRWLPKRPAH